MTLGPWRRAKLFALPAALVALVLPLAAHTGWFSSPRAWPAATGWDAIPPEQRPEEAPPQALAGDGGDEPEIHWLGHSGFALRWHGTRLLLDPNTSARCTLSWRMLEPALDARDLGAVDAVLISHAHYDHLDLPTLRAVPRIGSIVVPSGTEELLRGAEWRRTAIVPLRVGEVRLVGELEIISVPAAHNGNRHHPLTSRYKAVGYVVRHGRDAIYYAGDTGFGNDFASIRERYHPRLAILPIGAFSPRFPLKYYHLSPEEAVAAAITLGVDTVVPCHFGTFALSLDRPSSALPRFAREAHDQGVLWSMPRLLTDGRRWVES